MFDEEAVPRVPTLMPLPWLEPAWNCTPCFSASNYLDLALGVGSLLRFFLETVKRIPLELHARVWGQITWIL